MNAFLFPELVLNPVSIQLNEDFIDAFNNLSSENAIQLIQQIESEVHLIYWNF